ncbi:glycosyltransferase, partial [Candidatus Kaiserbacteria bacterium]|nr:glycosyltransferase [Candidatus Kaiserbacteria bacterium]
MMIVYRLKEAILAPPHKSTSTFIFLSVIESLVATRKYEAPLPHFTRSTSLIVQQKINLASYILGMKKKKILFIITKSNFGGAQRYVYDIARSLSPDAFDVVVAFGGEGLLKDKLAHAKIRTVPIEDLERDINIFNEIDVFFQLLKLYRVEKPDIVHLNSSKIGGIGALAGRIAQVPLIIFTAHGWAFNEERSWGARKIIAFLYWITLI